MRFKDRTAIVTGAETGIGRAIVERLALEGAAVVLADLADAEHVAQGIREKGGNALAMRQVGPHEAMGRALRATCCLSTKRSHHGPEGVGP